MVAGASADGSVIVGRLDSGRREVFRFTDETGLVKLDDLFNPTVVSADGSMIFGETIAGDGSQAVVWDATHGVRYLRDVFTNEFGLDLTEWNLRSANGVSADGTVIVGYGMNPFGHFEGWMAVVPEPATNVLWLLGLMRLFVSHGRIVEKQEV
jgi:uncharacterized membrane protein